MHPWRDLSDHGYQPGTTASRDRYETLDWAHHSSIYLEGAIVFRATVATLIVVTAWALPTTVALANGSSYIG